MGVHLSRRQLLRHAGLVAATFPVAGIGAASRAWGQAGPAIPMHAELVTVTDTEMVVTGFTGDPMQPDEYGRPTPVATPTQFSPIDPDPTNGGVFTTLVAPRGRELLRVAWMNDLHIGEHVSGLAHSDDRLPGGGFPPGYEVDPENPYWRFMAQGALAGARVSAAAGQR